MQLRRLAYLLSAARSRLQGYGLRAAFPLRMKGLKRVGSAYGGWFLPEIDPSWACCTVGVGEDASFDVALAQRGCTVLAVDPTPRAIAYIGPLLKENHSLRLAPYALWSEAAQLEFFSPENAEHVSYSAVNLQNTTDTIWVAAKPLPDILTEYGLSHVDLLKLDIEGAEYEVLPKIDLVEIGVHVLCVEFHFAQGGLRSMIRAIRSVERSGFRVARVAHTDVTFLRSQ